MAPAALSGTPPAARLLDLSRLVSRVGRGPLTGVDRVEAAYLAQLLTDPVPLFALVRTPSAFTLLDRRGTGALAERLLGTTPWGAIDRRARLHRKATPAAQAAESDLRRLALGRRGARGLARLLAEHLPPGTVWLNTGHSNLHTEVFDAIHALSGGRASVLLHDTIPLDFPAYQRPGTVKAFETRMRAVASRADLVICISQATRADASRHFTAMGRVPEMITAPLGVETCPAQPNALAATLPLTRPYFVVLGTIEPRKNHALLLDIWDHFAETLPDADIPSLIVAGQRGWANAAVFRRLDNAPLMGRPIHEVSGLTDCAVVALVENARALLMPSFAEGFGLPVAEALARGTAAIANDLPVYRETLGNKPIYLNVADMYSWAEKILDLARAEKKQMKAADGTAIAVPTWQEHFNLVLKVT